MSGLLSPIIWPSMPSSLPQMPVQQMPVATKVEINETTPAISYLPQQQQLALPQTEQEEQMLVPMEDDEINFAPLQHLLQQPQRQLDTKIKHSAVRLDRRLYRVHYACNSMAAQA